MTKKFYEIILSELVNRRDVAEVALSEVYYKKEFWHQLLQYLKEFALEEF